MGNAEMFQDSSARMYQDRWQSRTADRSQDNSARMFPVNSARMCQDKSQERNAPMCQDSSAGMSHPRSVPMSPSRSAEMFQDSSVNKFHSRCVTQHSQLMESKETNSSIKIHSPENPYNNIFMLNIETPSQVF